MEKKVVITVRSFGMDQMALSQRLLDHGFEVSLNSLDEINDVDKIIELTKGHHAIIAGGELWNHRALTGVSDTVEIITRFGAGYDKVDLSTATALGIAIANTPGASASTVGEHAVALMLAVLRGIPKYDRKTREGQWPTLLISQLTGKTVGLVGMGAIATVAARILQGFSTRILAYDVTQNMTLAAELGIKYVSLDELLKQSDVVSLHTPLTDGTAGMVNASFLDKMKRSAILINTSRGKVINETDLITALQQGRIAGAGLDVFEQEPIGSDNLLTQLDHVVLSSHIGGMSVESYKAMMDMAIENIIDFYSTGSCKNMINPEYAGTQRGDSDD